MCLSTLSLNAQLLWNIRGGAAYTRCSTWDETGINYLGELGIDIPFSQTTALEVSLMYKNILLWDKEDDQGWDYLKPYWDNEENDRANLLELPIKFGYKLRTGKRSLVRFAAGPYISAGLDEHFRIYQSGLTTAVTFEYRKINVGISYDLGIYHHYKVDNPNTPFLTFGIKFGASGWKGIAVGAAAIGGAALAISNAYNNSNSNQNMIYYDDFEGESTYDNSTSTNTNSSQKKSKTSSADVRYMNGSYKSDLYTYSGYEDQLIKMKVSPEKYSHLSHSQYVNQAKSIQKKMKTIRERIISHGGTCTESSYEGWARSLK